MFSAPISSFMANIWHFLPISVKTSPKRMLDSSFIRVGIVAMLSFLEFSLGTSSSSAAPAADPLMAPSGAFLSSGYTISKKAGLLSVSWSALGLQATELNSTVIDVPYYTIQIVDVTQGVVKGSQLIEFNRQLPETNQGNGSFIITSQSAWSAQFFSYPVNIGDVIRVEEDAEIITGGGTLSSSGLVLNTDGCRVVKRRTSTLTFKVTKRGLISEKGDNGSDRSVNPQNQVNDPVDVTTGAFSENEVDLHVNGPLPIEVRRTYSSTSTSASNEFGYGWLMGYSSYLIPSDDLSTIQAVDTGGSVIRFRQNGNIWAPLVADNPGLTKFSGGQNNLLNSSIAKLVGGNGAITYQWRLPDGSVRNYLVQQFPITSDGINYTRQRPYLSSIIDNRGNSLTFSYGSSPTANDYGQINLIQSSNGSSVSFTYDTEGHITQAAASDGRTVNYAYSYFVGDLISVQRPDGSIYNYEYGFDADGVDNHQLTKVISPEGRVLENVYDGSGRVVQQKATVDQSNPAALVTTANYDYSFAGQTRVTDAYNNPTVYQYTSGGLITKTINPLGQVTSRTWYNVTDGSGAFQNSLQSVTDRRGLTSSYKYDAQGNVTQTTLVGDLDGDPNTTEVATATAIYNSLNLPTSITDTSGVTTTFSYGDINYPYSPTQIATYKNHTLVRVDALVYTSQGGSKGLLSTKTVAAASADQAITHYTYNSAGFVTQQTIDTGTTDPNVVTNFSYNNRGELITATDADGRSTNYTYDAMSRQLSKVVKDESGAILGTWTTSYTANGEVKQTVGARSVASDSVLRYYDGAGRLEDEVVNLSQALPNGRGVTSSSYALTSYGFDYSGNIILRIDPNDNVTTMTYDPIGQLLTKNTADLRSEAFQYEPGGKVSQYTNPLGGITKTYYTSTGQLRRQENPDGSILQWSYYTDGRLQNEILRNGSVWTTVYDDVARSVARTLTSSNGSVLAIETSVFDRRGNLITHTDPEGFVKTTAYDGLNRTKTVTGPAGVAGSAQQTTTFIYGASSKTVTVLNGLNEQTTTTSDALGRPQQTRVLASNGEVIRSTKYTYSSDHNAVTVTEGTGLGAVSRTTWTDTLNRPVLTVFGDGSFTRSVYDFNGNLVSSIDALGQATNYAYNALNQSTSQTLPDGTVTRFTYDATGNLLTRSMANGTLTYAQTFDNAGRKLTERLFSGTSVTRQYSYTYYSLGTPAVGLLQTATTPRETVTTTYDSFLRPQAITTSGSLPETNGTTSYSYDRRNLLTVVDQSSVGNAAGPASRVSRTFDGYGQLRSEVVAVGGSTYANVTQTWDAAGRRASLDEASSTLASPLFSYQYRGDGLLVQVSANNQNYAFSYADNGLLTSRTNAFRSLTVNMRDAAGRLQEQAQTVGSTAAIIEDVVWRANNTLSSYTATRSDSGAWNDTRLYSYNSRGQLLSEGFSPGTGSTNYLNYKFDGVNGLGVLLNAKIGTGAPVSWETSATANSLGRVTVDSRLAGAGGTAGRSVPASGSAVGADHVDILVDGVAQGRAAYNGSAWSINLALSGGPHTLTANAVDPSGLFTATKSSSFTVTAANSNDQAGTVTTDFDNDGNVIGRNWASGVSQTLAWDGLGRLIKVAQRDGANNGYDWTAIYDGLGRRIKTVQQVITNSTVSGTAGVTTSIFDPMVEFLEIGVSLNGAKAWKVYGPDLNGRYGSLQGTGGLEATIVDASRATKGVINDQFGNGIASLSSEGIGWFTTHVGGYGPLSGNSAEILTDITRVAEATAWRGRRIDPTGYYNLGARYYESMGGRFLSADPMGHTSSMSLYDFCNGDPVNSFDPDGRCLKSAGQGLAKGADFFINLVIGTLGSGDIQGFTPEEMARLRAINVEDYGSWFRRMGAYDETRATKMLVEQLPEKLSPAVNDMTMAAGSLHSELSEPRPETLPEGDIPGGLPPGATIRDVGESFYVIDYGDGKLKIRFYGPDATQSFAPSRKIQDSEETEVRISSTNQPFVGEGKHRLNAVVIDGKTVAESIPGASGWLEYDFGGYQEHNGVPPGWAPTKKNPIIDSLLNENDYY